MKERSKLNVDDENGEFWMEYSDVCKFFRAVTTCTIDPDIDGDGDGDQG